MNSKQERYLWVLVKEHENKLARIMDFFSSMACIPGGGGKVSTERTHVHVETLPHQNITQGLAVRSL